MAATALALLSAGANLASGYEQSQAIRAQGSYEKQRMLANARLADLEAADATQRGKMEVQAIQRSARRLAGAQRVAAAGQGLEVGSGSVLDLELDTAALSAMDVEQARRNAFKEAWGFRVRALDDRGRASFTGRAARNQARSTIVTAGMQAGRDLNQAYYYQQKGK